MYSYTGCETRQQVERLDSLYRALNTNTLPFQHISLLFQLSYETYRRDLSYMLIYFYSVEHWTYRRPPLVVAE